MHQLTIMMATYNGSEFIREQLDSLERQDVEKILLVVSDDGSKDDTLEIIQYHCATSNCLDLTILQGPKKGFAANYRHLILETRANAEYFAFCDQDDIWFDDKCSRSLQWLGTIESNTPALYSGRTQIMSSEGKVYGELSSHFKKPPSFRNALVQSIAGANTMTMNRAAFELLCESIVHGVPVSHDWWSYKIVTGAGGLFKYDTDPLVNYRQHAGNLVGSNNSAYANIKRIRLALSGRFRQWNQENIDLLDKCTELLTPQNRSHFENFKKVHNAGIFNRLLELRRSGLYRQTTLGQCLLWIAAVLGKL